MAEVHRHRRAAACATGAALMAFGATGSTLATAGWTIGFGGAGGLARLRLLLLILHRHGDRDRPPAQLALLGDRDQADGQTDVQAHGEDDRGPPQGLLSALLDVDGELGDARQLGQVEDVHHVAVHHLFVGAHHQAHVGIGRHGRLHLVGERVLGRVDLVPAQPPVLEQLDLGRLVGGAVGRLGARQLDLQRLRDDVRRGDHQDDQQHQHHVDQRRDVDLRDRADAAAAARPACRPRLRLDAARRRLAGRGRHRIGSGVAVGASVRAHRGDDDVAERGGVLLDVAALLLEHVVDDDGGERDQDADRGGDQRLGDAAHDVAHRAAIELAPSSRKAVTMPSTVPKRPMKGALLPSVPKNKQPALERLAPPDAAREICSTASGPSSYQSSASRMIVASTPGSVCEQLARRLDITFARSLAQTVRPDHGGVDAAHAEVP